MKVNQAALPAASILGRILVFLLFVGEPFGKSSDAAMRTNPPTKESGDVIHADGSITHVFTQDIRYGSITPSFHWYVDEKDGRITHVTNPDR
jgi:hypothetical protein